jgi:KipI family sensor histidine kinase inhibitor
MIGFVPGYPYMGDLPAKLHLPRRIDPRTRVPPGSVAIATSMTAVYPYESPGGWHLIGTSPVRFFDPESANGALLGPGDAVKFRPVTPAEFADIRRAVERNAYLPDSKEIAA